MTGLQERRTGDVVSRPDAATTAEPRIPRAERTVHRRSAPVPLRVVSQRLSPEEAQLRAPRPGRPAAGPGTTTAPTTGAVATLAQPPLPSPEIVGLPAPGLPLPVLDRRTRRRPFARLISLVRGRRRAEIPGGRRRAELPGRHRPDATPSQGWSMFAPQRRSRRRFGVRR
jgi:hypothetical protein